VARSYNYNSGTRVTLAEGHGGRQRRFETANALPYHLVPNRMALSKVTVFDRTGVAQVAVDEEGQAKPCVLGVRWVNPVTFETIRVRGGKRTGPAGEVLQELSPTIDLSPFANNRRDKGKEGKAG